ncbi:MAG TPA: hypothetical protein VMT05_05245 [Terriglobales bacterium]|jgi:hypothetical protein|nr:hypothetical protein [Terriglobales bacterium]
MADRLYLSLWFPGFSESDMLGKMLCVLRQFPFAAARPGIGYLAVHPISWNEPVLYQETFDYRATPEHAIETASELLHDDNAYELEALWDLWAPGEDAGWVRAPRAVEFVAHGLNFDNGAYEQEGHIQVDFGLDTPFLYEDVKLTPLSEARVRDNVQQLIGFTTAVEKNCGTSARLLWSESDENLAQKLIARLQKVQ